MDSRRRKLNNVKDQHSRRQSKKQTSGKELMRCVLNPFINARSCRDAIAAVNTTARRLKTLLKWK